MTNTCDQCNEDEEQHQYTEPSIQQLDDLTLEENVMMPEMQPDDIIYEESDVESDESDFYDELIERTGGDQFVIEQSYTDNLDYN